tara:strand:- start:272 stop:1150 length:879 start_codon:yes stop_codon:yes gene_type:complete
MGTWGAGIFDCDLGEDVKATFRDHIADGLSPEDAVSKLVEEYDTTDPDEGPDFWLTLAATQVQLGRLTELVKIKALEVLQSGSGLEAFARDCPDEVPARKRALKRLEKRILGKQKKPTKVKKPFVDTIDWSPGDGLAYQLRSGMWTGLKARDIKNDFHGPQALYEVVNLYQETMPTESQMRDAEIHLDYKTMVDLAGVRARREEIERLRKEHSAWPNAKDSNWDDSLKNQWCHAMAHSVFQLYRLGPRDKPKGRIVKVCEGLSWERYTKLEGIVFGGWKELDDYLERSHGFK